LPYTWHGVRPSLSLSQTLSGWQLIENRAMLLCHEGSLQAYWLDGRRSDPLASMPYTGLRDAIIAHPTMAEGLGALFSNVPAR
jgi:hypothetical protein